MKKTLAFITAMAVVAQASFALEKKTAEISGAIENVLEDLSEVLPENSSLLGVQPDAYIGKLFPSVPPHLTAGLSVTGTVINTSIVTDQVQTIIDSLSEMFKEDGIADEINMDNLDIPSKLPLPSAAVSARLGGIIIPVDIGLYGASTFNFLDNLSKDDFDAGLKYSTFGFDARYPVYEGSTLLPKISVGGGYSYSTLSADLGMSSSFTTNELSELDNRKLSADLSSDIDMSLKNHTIFAEVQASKKLLFITPYVGLKAMLTKSVYDYDWNYKTKLDRTELNNISDADAKTTANAKADEIESDFSDKDSRNYTKDFDLQNLATQIYGGLGLQLGYLQMAFNVAYNFKTQYFSGGLGINLKI